MAQQDPRFVAYARQGYAQAGAGAHAAIAESREKFLVRSYNHLFGAILAFAAIEIGLFTSGLALPIAEAMMGGGWLLVLGAFMIISWFATSAVHRTESKAAQYGALTLFVVAEAIIFVPMLFIANSTAPGVIQSAGLVTMLGFGGLTGIAFWTRKDFSFLGGIIRWGMMCALVLIVASLIFGFSLGVLFSVAMVALAGGSILHTTSAMLRTFPTDRHVAAALHLFSSVALMFWYVLSIFLGSRR